MTMIPVRDIELRNSEFLDIRNEYKDILLKKEEGSTEPLVAKGLPISNLDDKAEDFVSDEYLHEIIAMETKHDGFPAKLKGFTGLKHQDFTIFRVATMR